MSALPTRTDLAGTPTRAELQTILLAMYDMVAQRLAAGTTGAGTASGAEILLAQQSLEVEPGVDVAAAGANNDITSLLALSDSSLALAKLADIATASILGRSTSGTGAIEVLTPSQVRSIIGAGEVLIETKTASGATVLDFTTGIDSTYDQYVLRITDFSVATDNCNVLMRFSTDAGASFISAASYVWNQILTTDGVNGATSGVGDTALRLITGQSNTASIYCGGEIRFTGLSGSRYKGFNSDFTYARSGSNIAKSIVGGWIANTTAVNAIRVLLGGGTTFSGKFSLYGLVK